MRILVIGSGAREHALAWRLAQDDSVEQVLVSPGNSGTRGGKLASFSANGINEWIALAKKEQVDLSIVGSEQPLVSGIADEFSDHGLALLGPRAAPAMIEGSKLFAKKIMRECKISSPEFVCIADFADAAEALNKWKPPYVLKLDGLANGKGSFVINSLEEAKQALARLSAFKKNGVLQQVLFERHIDGEELSLIALCDGNRALCLGTAKDYKRLRDDDHGPNTGGMGAASPSLLEALGKVDASELAERFILPVLEALRQRGDVYRGFLYAGLIVSRTGEVHCLEFNCRMGDPEAQVMLPRLEGDFAQACLQAATGELGPAMLSVANKSAVGVVLASEGYPDAPQAGEKLKLPASLEDEPVFHGAAMLDSEGEIVSAGGRVATCMAVRKTIAEARSAAYERISEARLKNSHYRRDIAASLD